MKILNLYAGIGGNRKLWGNEYEITAVEINERIAKVYQDFFPNDNLIVTDAHQYLLEHYKEFDFIWSSPPCQSHSRIRKNSLVARGDGKPIYPDMNLYEEILFLQGYFKGKWVVENVIGFYEPLIKPQEIGKHYFWANFNIPLLKKRERFHNEKIRIKEKRKGFNLSKYHIGHRKDQILNNCTEPELGLHIFQCAIKTKQTTIDGGTNFTKSSADDFPTESLISVKRESADSPNSPHDTSTIKEEANFS